MRTEGSNSWYKRDCTHEDRGLVQSCESENGSLTSKY
jgi:hypothetical protein